MIRNFGHKGPGFNHRTHMSINRSFMKDGYGTNTI